MASGYVPIPIINLFPYTPWPSSDAPSSFFVDTAIVFVDNRRAFKSLHFGVCKRSTEVDFDLGQGAFADCCAAPGN
jgi:hypothetical protein